MVGYLEGRQHSEIGPFEGETSMAVCKNEKIYMKDRHVQKQLVSRYHLLTCCMFFFNCILKKSSVCCCVSVMYVQKLVFFGAMHLYI